MFTMRMLLVLVVLICLIEKSFSQGVFVVLRDVPESPTVVVVPNSYNSDEIDLADKVEELLMKFKVKIVERPSVRRITETKNAAKETSGEEGIAVGAKGLKEEYYAYEETGADFLLLTDERQDRAKLIRIKTKEILASSKALKVFQGPCDDAFYKVGSTLGFENIQEYCLYKMLEAAGLTNQVGKISNSDN